MDEVHKDLESEEIWRVKGTWTIGTEECVKESGNTARDIGVSVNPNR